ncbi:armadillo-type protein [Mycena rebaudengoi]|nr:armadillo-type protein [Mycena rebaudengoi]
MINQLLQSSNSDVRMWICALLGNLVGFQPTVAAVWEGNRCTMLVELARDPETDVVASAVRALVKIALQTDGALAVVEAGVSHTIDQLLESLDSGVRTWACNLLGNLALHESTASAAWQERRCHRLVKLSCDDSPAVADNAVYALSQIARWVDGGDAVVDARALQLFENLVQSSIVGVRRWTCVMVANLVRHPSTRSTVLAVYPCGSLVDLLRDEHPEVIVSASSALSWISESLEGAQAVIEAGANQMIDQLLQSSNTDVQRSTCFLLGNLVGFQPTVAAIWEGNRCTMLVELARDPETDVVESAVCALAEIALQTAGALAVVEAGILKHSDELLESANVGVREWACDLMERLACHESTASTLVKINPCRRLVALLRDPETDVVESAVRALAQIALQTDGALAVVEAGVSQTIDQLLESLDSDIRTSACDLLGTLAIHESTASAAWLENRCHRLVKLSCDDSPSVVERAVYALSRIAYWVDGGDAVADAGVLQFLENLVQTSDVGVRRWTWAMLEGLACHQSTSAALFGTNLCERLMKLLISKDPDIISAATSSLSIISRSTDGAQAVIQAGTLSLLDTLLEYPHDDVRGHTCALLCNLTGFESCVDAVLEGNSCARLVSLLRDPSIPLRSIAVLSLAKLCRWPKAAAAIAKTNVLGHVSELMESPDRGVQLNTSIILAHLPRCKPVARSPAILFPARVVFLCLWAILESFGCLWELLRLVSGEF